MVSLVNALKSFQSGSLSREELFAEVEQMLQGGRVNESWLLRTLEEENTKVPLPEDGCEVVHSRIERAAEIKQGKHSGGAEPGLDGNQFVDPDQSRTLLATSLYQNGATPSGADQEVGSAAPPPPRLDPGSSAAPEAERMKGKGDILNNRFVLDAVKVSAFK